MKTDQEHAARLSLEAGQEMQFRALIESSSDILYKADLNGVITFISPSVKRLSGYSVEEAIGLNLMRDIYAHPQDREDIFAGLQRHGEVKNFTAQLRRKDGSIWWATTNTRFFHDLNGSPAGIEGIVRDISDLREADFELRQLFAMSLDMLCIADLETATFIKVNPAFTSILGYSEEELLNRPFLSFIHPGDVQATIGVIEEKLKRGEPAIHFLNRYRCKNGSYRWLSWLSKPMVGDGKTYAVAHDVTEEKAAIEALRDSEQRFRSIIESSPMGVHLYELTEDDRLIFVGANPAADAILGVSNSSYIGKDIEEAFPPLTRTEIPDAYRSVCRSGSPWQTEQVIFEDRQIAGAYEVHAFQTSPGKMAVFFLDITGRKRAEAEKQILQEQLQQAQKMEAIGTLAGGIAHEFNNILMAIQGRLSLVQSQIEPTSPTFANLTGIDDYIKTAADLTQRLLGFARGGKYEVRTVDVNELVQSSAAMFSQTRKEIRTRTSLQDGLWSVDGDRQQLHQVLLNLYLNAWQAMVDGGDLTIKTENVRLDPSSTRPVQVDPGLYVKISVADTGVGMSHEVLQKIFEPFFTTRVKNRGTGLGLASAYGIVKNHGGTIVASSEPGSGSTFDIYLPANSERSDTASKAVAGRPAEPKIFSETNTILLVDDESIVREVGAEMLKSLGYQVVKAANGNEAIALYEEHRQTIDLVILDMIMPEMDGSAVFSELRRIDPAVKVILSSGYSLDGKASKIMADGCNGFMQKPFNMKELDAKVREVIECRSGQD